MQYYNMCYTRSYEYVRACARARVYLCTRVFVYACTCVRVYACTGAQSSDRMLLVMLHRVRQCMPPRMSHGV